MRKVFFGVFISILLFIASSITYAAEIQIKVDGVDIVSDVKPEIMNNRTMVPLRVISENLGANVDWSNSEVTFTKSNIKVILNLNSITEEKNGEKILLEIEPYIKNNRIFVPLRFISETFGCDVNYSNFTVTIDTKPLHIDGVQVKALQHEYHMTMGGVVQQINGNAYNEAIYNIFMENKGDKVDAPENYSWMYTMDILGSYYKVGQYDFLDQEDDILKSFEIYNLVESFPNEDLEGYPEILLYDVTENQWYLFNDKARKSINQLIDTASKNGFLKIISDTVV
ncbi:stalk domain-containing protein [Chengkuizengella sediminis]|uniref:stalk domain-containing protein n=1 Tax=Chengkuizengella sediminis TaxID=1885917 RepID=UPI001389CB68|nr:copper amine oxidase N-terminal domain-containing protein [Chengkuizengella sediminis]